MQDEALNILPPIVGQHLVGSRREPSNPEAPWMRVALVNPPDRTSSSGIRITPPLGLGYLAAVTREAGCRADIFDFVLETGESTSFIDESRIVADKYDVYGYTTYSETFLDTTELIRKVKNERPKAVHVVGGYHATAEHIAILRDFPEIDFVIRHDGEVAFRQLLEEVRRSSFSWGSIEGLTWRAGDGSIRANEDQPSIDQASLPYPVIHLRYGPPHYRSVLHQRTRRKKRVLNMISSRGCPKRCKFCSIITVNPFWKARSVESLIQEIRYRFECEGTFDHVMFHDANFFVNSERALQLGNALYAFNRDVTWSATATADLLIRNPDIIKQLGRLNCSYIEVGFESGNNSSLQRYKKGTSVEMNETVVELLSGAGIDIGLDFIMFEPEMSWADLQENYRFLYRNNFIGYWPADYLFQELRLFPATPFRTEYAHKMGVTFSPHVVPSTPFFDAAVSSAVHIMHTYLNYFQQRTNALISVLAENSLKQAQKDYALRGTPTLIQRAEAASIQLRHLPSRFFEWLVGLEGEIVSNLTFEDIIHQELYDFRKEWALHARSEMILQEMEILSAATGNIGSIS